MTIKDAIEKAASHGWGGFKSDKKPRVDMLENMCVGFSYPGSFDGVMLSLWDIVNQPLFWQCLGKGMGWTLEEHYPDSSCGRCMCCPSVNCQEWKYHWHALIDHLAEGKDITSYFEGL